MTDAVPVKRAKRGPAPSEGPSEYTIVAEAGVPELVMKVNEKMAAGWKPVGGPLKLGTDWGVAQAMVK
jgi:hypothetical protein